jgi:hypothetical protein
VTAEIVHDDDIARRERWNQDLIDVGLEPDAINRPVEHHRRYHSCQPQGANESCRFPMAVRNAGAQALSLWSASAASRHIGRRPCFINEHKALWIEVQLSIEPVFPPFQNVGTVLLRGMCGFF